MHIYCMNKGKVFPMIYQTILAFSLLGLPTILSAWEFQTRLRATQGRLSQEELKSLVCSDPEVVALNESSLGRLKGAKKKSILKDLRTELRHELQEVSLLKTYDFQQSLLPLMAFAGVEVDSRTCPEKLLQKEQSFVEAWGKKHRALVENAEVFERDQNSQLKPIWNVYSSVFVLSVFELQLLDSIFLSNAWKTPPLWPSEKVKSKIQYLPFLLSHSPFRIGHPSVRAEEILQQFPFLRIPTISHLGVPVKTVGEEVFEELYLLPQGESIRSYLIKKLSHFIDRRLSLLTSQPETKTILLDNITDGLDALHPLKRMEQDEKLQLEAYLQFFLYDYKDFIAKEVSPGHLRLNSLKHRLSEILEDVQAKVVKGQSQLCYSPPDFYPAPILRTYLQDNIAPQGSKELLFAYCDASWSHSSKRKGEAVSELIGMAAGLTGVAVSSFKPNSAKKTADLLIKGSSAMVATSFLSRAMRGYRGSATDDLLAEKTKREAQFDAVANHTNLAMVPLSFAGMQHFGKQMSRQGGAWKLLAPWFNFGSAEEAITYFAFFGTGALVEVLEFQANGVDPFKEGLGEFLASRVQNHFDALLFSKSYSLHDTFFKARRYKKALAGHLRYVYYYLAMSFASDHVTQQLSYLSQGSELNMEVYRFRPKWLASGYLLDRGGVFFGVFPFLDMIEEALPANPYKKLMLKTVPNVLWQYFFNILYGKTYPKFVTEKCQNVSLKPLDWSHFSGFRWPKLHNWTPELRDLLIQYEGPRDMGCQEATDQFFGELENLGITPQAFRDLSQLASNLGGESDISPFVNANFNKHLHLAKVIDQKY